MRRFETTLQHTNRDDIQSVLDVGCGSGRYVFAFAKQGKTVVGVDMAKGMLELAQNAVDEAGLSTRVTLCEGDYLNVSLSQKFDAACLMGFFDYIVGRNIKIMTNQKIHYISTSSTVPIIESIENARMNLRRSRPNSIQQNVVQNIVQGDTITKTEIKDSVINRSNLGNNEDDKVAKIEKISEMKEKGLISDEEFEKMKKDIIG